MNSIRGGLPAALINRLLPGLLVVIHAALLMWALVGTAEYLLPDVPWPAVTNPLFPDWVLALHWSAIGLAGLVFLGGYVMRWRHTPRVMAAIYAYMALVCAIETLGFMTHSLRFVAMAAEYAAYVGIGLALFRLPSLRRRFNAPAA